MKWIAAPVGKGKTTAAIALAIKHDAYLVVCSLAEANRIDRMRARDDIGIRGLRTPVTFNQLLDGKLRGVNPCAVVIDNVDMLLRLMIGEVIGATYTKETVRGRIDYVTEDHSLRTPLTEEP